MLVSQQYYDPLQDLNYSCANWCPVLSKLGIFLRTEMLNNC